MTGSVIEIQAKAVNQLHFSVKQMTWALDSKQTNLGVVRKKTTFYDTS